MRSFTFSVLTIYLAAATSAATAQTVTVGKTGTVDHGTIQAAIDSFATTDDPMVPNVVQITDSAVYDEVININVPLTLIGTGTNRPVLAVQSNPLGYDDDGYNNGNSTNLPQRWMGDAGLLINLPDTLSTASMALHNLIIIPSRTGTPPIAGIVNKANNFFLDLENLLVTSNNGSDQPVSTDGMSDASGAVATSFRVSGAHIGSHTNNRPEGDGVEVHMRDCIFTNIKGDVGTTWRSGFYMYRTYNTFSITNEPIRPGAFRRLMIDEKCLFSYNNGSGLRCAASLEILTPTDRTLFIGNSTDNLWLDMQAGADINGDTVGDNVAYLNGIISYLAGAHGINEGVGSGGPRVNLKNSILANNGSSGVYHRLGNRNLQGPSQYENVTVANNAFINDVDQIHSSRNVDSIDLESTNTIIAGKGLVELPKNRVHWETNGVLTFTNTALVTEGPFALNPTAPIVTHASAVINGTFVTNADPEFVNTTDPTDPDFYAVANSDYGNLAYEGGPLTGGGRYVGASVSDWTLY